MTTLWKLHSKMSDTWERAWQTSLQHLVFVIVAVTFSLALVSA